MFAAAAMSMSSVSVVSNALRLKFFKPARMTAEPEDKSTALKNDDTQVITEDLSNKSNNINGGNEMKKVLVVEGMSCGHCKAAVEKALKSVAGVENAVVDLNSKTAEVTLTGEVSGDVLSKAVTDAGYEVVEVK